MSAKRSRAPKGVAKSLHAAVPAASADPTFVHGLGPDFEETTVVAPSFDAFLLLLVQQVRERDERGSLWPFLFAT